MHRRSKSYINFLITIIVFHFLEKGSVAADLRGVVPHEQETALVHMHGSKADSDLDSDLDDIDQDHFKKLAEKLGLKPEEANHFMNLAHASTRAGQSTNGTEIHRAADLREVVPHEPETTLVPMEASTKTGEGVPSTHMDESKAGSNQIQSWFRLEFLLAQLQLQEFRQKQFKPDSDILNRARDILAQGVHENSAHGWMTLEIARKFVQDLTPAQVQQYIKIYQTNLNASPEVVRAFWNKVDVGFAFYGAS